MPVDIRLIEFMPMGGDTLWGPETFWPADAIRSALETRVRLIPDLENCRDAGPARMYRVEGASGRLGFITAVSSHFCAACNRLRLTCDGNLRTCLFDDHEYRLRGMLRNPACTDDGLARAIRLACMRNSCRRRDFAETP